MITVGFILNGLAFLFTLCAQAYDYGQKSEEIEEDTIWFNLILLFLCSVPYLLFILVLISYIVFYFYTLGKNSVKKTEPNTESVT